MENQENNEDKEISKELKDTPENTNNPPKDIASYTDKMRENPWIVSTLVLGILGLILLIANFGGMTGGIITGSVVSEGDIEDLATNFFNTKLSKNPGEVISIESISGLYKIIFDLGGEKVPLYFTKDGQWIAQGGELVPITIAPTTNNSSPTSIEIPKSNKPIVELFVMAYCPYGTQAEKGILPVAELLGDKIDFRIRYVNYLMHGEKEATENLREYCIQEIASTEEFLDYMHCFLKGDGVESSGGYITKGNDVDFCLAEAGIDSDILESCMTKADVEYSITKNLEDESSWLNGVYPLFNVDSELNEEYGVRGSPTLVINGQIISSGRDPASYLSTICSAFNTAPEECDVELSSASPSPYFGWESSGSDTQAQC